MQNLEATRVVKSTETVVYDSLYKLLEKVSTKQHKSFTSHVYDFSNKFFIVERVQLQDYDKNIYYYKAYYVSPNHKTSYVTYFIRENDKQFPAIMDDDGNLSKCENNLYVFEKE